MKNRSAFLLLFLLIGLSLARITCAQQQSSGNDSRNKAAETNCQTPVTIKGAVIAPSRVELRRRVRLIEVLALVGGLTERAGKTVEITRAALGLNCARLAPADSNQKPGSVEIYNLDEVKRGSENANPYLQPGDFVSVPEVGVAYVTGNVANPGAIILKEPTTVTQAIAMAGGLLPDSLTNRVRIIRPDPFSDSTAKETVVDLKAIKKGRARDVVLQPYDIVEVPSKKGVGDPLRRPVQAPPLPLRIIY